MNGPQHTLDESGPLPPQRPATDSMERDRTAASVAGALFGLGEAVKLGRFSLLERCGSGAMGHVYSAWDPRLNRRVAIKVLREHAEDTGRILREARATARLSHPNVVTVYDAAEDRGRSYIAMEFIDGDTLPAWLRASERSLAQIRDVFAQLARGLHAAHRSGLVHRDFKPTNAMISTRDGRPHAQVLDFGLTVPVLETGEGVSGTPAYMAPEQRLGDPPTPAADQYAFFVSLVEAVTGVRPKGRTPSVEGMPRSLRRLAEIGLRQDPTQRHGSMAAVASALEPSRHRPSLWMLGGGIVALGLGAVASSALHSDPLPDPCASVQDLWTQAFEPRPALPERVATALDDYGAAWVDARRSVCAATFHEGVQTQDLLEVRNGCLHARQLAAAAVIDVLQTEPERAPQALSVLAGLPDPGECVTAQGEPRNGSEALERALAALSARLGFLAWDHARSLAEAIAEQPQSADPSQEIRRRLLSAVAYERAGDSRAQGLLDEAIELAIEHGEPADAASVASEKVWVHGIRGGDLDGARQWAHLGQSWLRAAGLHEGPRAAQLLDRLGGAAMQSGQLEMAQRLRREALSLMESSPHPARRIPFLIHLHATLDRTSEEATALRERTRALIETHFGPEHPMLAVLLTTGRLSFEAPGACAQALPDYQEALRIKEAHYGPDARDVAPALTNLANCQGVLGDLDGAAASLQRSIEIHEAHDGSDSPALFAALYSLGIAQLYDQRYADALATARRCEALLAARAQAQPSVLAGPALVSAMALAGLNRRDEAAEAFERTEALQDETTSPADRVEARIEHAKLLREMGRPDEALALKREARALAEASGDPAALSFVGELD